MAEMFTLPKNLKGEIKSLIVQAVQDVLGDPDFGLELSVEAKKRLHKEERGKAKLIPFSEIKQKYHR